MVEVDSLATKNKKILSIKVIKKATPKDIKKISIEIEKILKTNKYVNLLIDLTNFNGWKIKTVPRYINLVKKYQKYVKLISVIGSKAWIKTLAKSISLFAKVFLNPQIKCFDATKKREAKKRLM